jgi:stage III sporulation protein AH
MKMILRKQTVWLLTMLAVMVVLSGYYLVKGPTNQPALGEENKLEAPLAGVEVDSHETDQPATDAKPVKGTGEAADTDTAKQQETPQVADQDVLPNAASDTLTGMRMQREATIQRLKDEQMTIMMNSDSSQAIADAKLKYDQLSTQENNSIRMEELLKVQGYKDAIVDIHDNGVTVLVQKDKLEPKEVVDIIALAKQELKVSGSSVTVRYTP